MHCICTGPKIYIFFASHMGKIILPVMTKKQTNKKTGGYDNILLDTG